PQRAARDESAVFAERVPRRAHGHVGVRDLLQRAKGCHTRRQNRGLRVAREHQLGLRTVEAGRADFVAERLVGDFEGRPRHFEAFGELLAHSDELRTLSWKAPSDAHRHIRTSALPQEMPAPRAHMSTVWPGLMRPSRTASSSAMGMEALEVLP